MSRAGELRERLAFQRRGTQSDGYGQDVAGDYETQFEERARLRPLRGTETIMAARLQGLQHYTVRVRQSERTRAISTAWRIVDARDTSRVFAISAPPIDPDEKGLWLEMVAVEGQPT